jgi:hypothetical protein
MDSVGVAVGIYGTDEWAERAKKVALPSVWRQTHACRFGICHSSTLAEARNRAAAKLETDWLIFLDADDELDERYVESMLAGDGDIRQPSTLGVYSDGTEDDYPVLIPPKSNLLIGNHLVIGSMVRSDLFFEVGGFQDLPILEDWDLWIRCWLAGAKIGVAPEAIYRVHVSQGRNSSDMHGSVYTQIQCTYVDEARARGLL